MFSISMTTGPCGRISNGSSTDCIKLAPCRRVTSLPGRLLLDGDFRVVLQLPADCAVSTRDHLVPRLNSALYLDVSIIGNARRYFELLRFPADFLEDHFVDFFPLLAFCPFLLLGVYHFGIVVALVTLLLHLLAMLDFFRT